MSGHGQPYHLLMARKANELLGDGEWHDLEEVMVALMDFVPPGVAERAAEASRKHSTRNQDSVRKKPATKEQAIRYGARIKVTAFLRGLSWEIDQPGLGRGAGPPRRIRQLRPHTSLRGDPYRLQRDQLILKIDRLEKTIVKMAKLMVDHGLAEQAERLTKGMKP